MSRAIWVVLMWMAAAPAMGGQSVLSVEAGSEVIDGKPMVVFKLTNLTDQPIKIPTARLPWRNRYSVVIALVDRKSSGPARAKFPIDDNFGGEIVEIGVGQSTQGAISLDRYVVDARSVLLKNEMLVFWYYNARGEGIASLGEYGGWFTFPRLQ